MHRHEAIGLLKRRIKARQANDQTELNKLDRQISAAVSKKEWPELRADSAEPESRYIKSPPPKDWEA